jgi:hypothetical protein
MFWGTIAMCFFRILVWVPSFYIYTFMYLYIAVLRKFLRECVMLCLALRPLLCVA